LALKDLHILWTTEDVQMFDHTVISVRVSVNTLLVEGGTIRKT